MADRPHQIPLQTRSHTLLRPALLVAYAAVYLLLFLPGALDQAIVYETLGVTALALWFGPIALVGAGSRRRWYDPATLFNLAVFYYAIKGVSLAMGEPVVYLQGYSASDIARLYASAALYLACGLITWNWTYHAILSHGGAPTAGAGAARSRGREPWPLRNRITRSVPILSLAGAVSLVLFSHATRQSLWAFLRDPALLTYLTDGTLGIAAPLANVWRMGAYLLPLASIVWLAVTLAQGGRPGVLWGVHATAGLLIYILIGRRAGTAGYVLSLLVAYRLSTGSVPVPILLGVGPATLIYAYAISAWRSITASTAGMSGGLQGLVGSINLGGIGGFLSGTDMSDIRLFPLVIDVYGRLRPLKYGTTLLLTVSQFMLRSLWPNKPLDLGLEMAALYDRPGSLAGTPPGFFPEWFMNFDLIGIIVGAALWGAGLAWLYRKWVLDRPNTLGTILYAILVPEVLLLPSTSIGNNIGEAMVPMGALAAVLLALRWVERPAHAPSCPP